MRGGGGEVYTWSKTSVKEKEGTYLHGKGGGGGGYRQRNTVCNPVPL